MAVPPKKTSDASEYTTIEEGILEAVRNVLIEGLISGEDKLVEKVVERIEDFGEYEKLCYVTPGPNDIRHHGARNLLHQQQVWILYLTREEDSPDTVKRQKNIAGHGYDLILADITLGGEVSKIVPLRVESGQMYFAGQIYVGVFQTWVAWKTQGFTVPSD